MFNMIKSLLFGTSHEKFICLAAFTSGMVTQGPDKLLFLGVLHKNNWIAFHYGVHKEEELIFTKVIHWFYLIH